MQQLKARDEEIMKILTLGVSCRRKTTQSQSGNFKTFQKAHHGHEDTILSYLN
jgi:hypothetical protein